MTEKVQIKTPLVSVVIPTYNRSKELARAIKSVLNQTYQNFEILVVDDGSEENLRVVCDSFNDQRIKFLRNDTHTNANVARNRGIKEAQGEYIAMLDSDDEYLPHHLSRRIEKMSEWGCDGIFGSAYIDNGEEQTLKLSRPVNKGELMLNYLLSTGSAPTPTHFYKTTAAKSTLWDETLLRHQDYDFSIRFSLQFSFKCDIKPTTIIHWHKTEKRKHDFQSSLKFIEKWSKHITPPLLIEYVMGMRKLAVSENALQAKEQYTKILKRQIFHITPSQWLQIKGATNTMKKATAMLRYFAILLCNTLRPKTQ